MKRILLGAMTAVAVSVSAVGLTAAAPGDQPAGMPGAERMQRWAADHEALLDARLGGMKAGLKLTPDQEKLWGPFEAAVRDAAKMRMEHMRDMFDRMRDRMDEDGQARSPVDRLEAMADQMSQAADALKKIVGAVKPFYASLDDSQKRIFGLLGRGLMMGHGHRHMGMMGGGSGMGMMGQGGHMGMMGGESNGMGMNGNGPGDEDSSDDE